MCVFLCLPSFLMIGGLRFELEAEDVISLVLVADETELDCYLGMVVDEVLVTIFVSQRNLAEVVDLVRFTVLKSCWHSIQGRRP